MAPPSLISLPPEIILNVFKSADDYTTVIALICTASIFYDVWCHNATLITNMVLPRTIEYFENAQKLLNTQDQAMQVSDCPVHLPQGSHQVAVQCGKRFQSNASAVATTFNMFDSSMNNIQGRHLKLTEEIRFKQAYYHLWTVICLSRISNGAKLLSSALQTTQEEIRLDIIPIALWLIGLVDPADAVRVGITTEGAQGRELLIGAAQKVYAAFDDDLAPTDVRFLQRDVANRFFGVQPIWNFVREHHPHHVLQYLLISGLGRVFERSTVALGLFPLYGITGQCK